MQIIKIPAKILNLCRSYSKFFELTEIMRQHGDSELIDYLNNVPTGDIQPYERRLLESRIIQVQSSNYLQNALHIFAGNANAKRHNLQMIQSIKANIYIMPGKDQYPKYVPPQKVMGVSNRNQRETG